ncbi:hypothetical protein JRQ81_019460 [Phrynocephalus forsythii]|uniref:Uncharacterized protein n=1 Tax=Phrynocephalus forsythii TaxID=171643 RepID=A0A9Q0XMF4_9SAUR|nr:hypothetical protein JRQ81_019460 [Phrynocephalus forsythii]
MAGKQSGLSTLVCNKVREEVRKAIKFHRVIHQLLCAKHLKYDHVVCDYIIKQVMKAIKYICSKALCHHQFQQFLLNIQAEYGDIVYHNELVVKVEKKEMLALTVTLSVTLQLSELQLQVVWSIIRVHTKRRGKSVVF